MDKSRNKGFLLFNGITCLFKWVRRLLFVILAALMIGFTNAFFNEWKFINDSKIFDDQEYVVNDDDTNL